MGRISNTVLANSLPTYGSLQICFTHKVVLFLAETFGGVYAGPIVIVAFGTTLSGFMRD
ncbi:hypothetical protein L873DRAFT_1047615 [Choiromyces venosus 120613-1]|uniref:Uncharacterized protein n=1 Tax=Choiromyces venosus 120613-1 TaxID=1336337 RepID=A0A3N4JN91_9PEZI|nr:hypothetical protein L873DRAFT_1047615 [Choiromyces venosus 120613-1]